ncbi:MAG TPA: response regulator, partial [Bacteroidetes bacterium]|nr:response regulator [Bacteroidota bacterium]
TKHKIPILLIDGSPADAKKIEKFLKEAGTKCEFHWRKTLFEGFNYLQNHQVELVLLDLNLPDSQGFKTINSFIERAFHVPFIVVTDTNNEIIGNQSVKAGAQDFLVKSQISSKQFGRSIRYALQRSKVQMKLEKTAKELETNKKRFLEAQQMAHFGTWEMDLVSNKMKWSDEVYRIFSFHPGSISPTLSDYLSYVHVEDRNDVEDFFDNIAKDGQLHQAEHRILIEGTHIRYLTIQGKVQVEQATGRILLVGSIQDITQRKISEKLIIDKNISNKTAKIQEEVLSDLSFQIRTPLSSVVNLLFLLENTEKSKQQSDYVNDLKTSVDDLALSVNNLLNFSVMVSDNVKLDEEEFNIREFIQGTQNVVAIKADKANLKLNIVLDNKLPEKVISDPKKLTQILYNLVDNAIKYSPQSGKVTISAKAENANATSMNLVFSVTDTGTGIPKEKIAQLLEADKLLLETDPEEEEGKKRQLGIAIVAKLTKTMGGKMGIKSKLGKGAEFTISIPVKTPRQATFGTSDKPDAPLKILLVEDHFLNQMATKKILTNWSEHVTVDIAENGLVGVEKFREYGYDLVLMDIQMPVMNGLESAAKIREFSDVPIIALTANSTKQEQDKCMKIGMNDYLSKPFKPKELFARIMNMISLMVN